MLRVQGKTSKWKILDEYMVTEMLLHRIITWCPPTTPTRYSPIHKEGFHDLLPT